MTGRVTGDDLIALAQGVMAGQTVGAALWDAAGPRLLKPDPEADGDSAEVTVTVRLKPRIAAFLLAAKADHDQLARFVIEALSEARRRGIDELRAQQAAKEPGDGRGVVVMPRDRMGDLG